MQVLVCLLISGLYFPIVTAVIGGIYFIGRMGYMWGYSKSPAARTPFVPLIMLPQLLLPFLAIASCIMLAQDSKDG